MNDDSPCGDWCSSLTVSNQPDGSQRGVCVMCGRVWTRPRAAAAWEAQPAREWIQSVHGAQDEELPGLWEASDLSGGWADSGAR
jgi:hypothetical protein